MRRPINNTPAIIIWISDAYQRLLSEKSGVAVWNISVFFQEQLAVTLQYHTDRHIESDRISSKHGAPGSPNDNGNIWLGTFLGLNKYNPRVLEILCICTD